ncbi:MAG: phage head-tail connector protein [Arcobacter sp.]|nr:phage head-tail connector protein [Arcobacter sp.]
MLKQIKTLLNIKDDSKDEIINIYLDILISKVKNYCSRDDIPKMLEPIIVDIFVNEYASKIKADENGTQNIASIKRGDTQINYSKTENVYNEMTGAGGAGFIKNYRLQLDNFRKMKKIR